MSLLPEYDDMWYDVVFWVVPITSERKPSFNEVSQSSLIQYNILDILQTSNNPLRDFDSFFHHRLGLPCAFKKEDPRFRALVTVVMRGKNRPESVKEWRGWETEIDPESGGSLETEPLNV